MHRTGAELCVVRRGWTYGLRLSDAGKEQEKRFFFEKKKQKTFGSSLRRHCVATSFSGPVF
jgi:hypothetical protein